MDYPTVVYPTIIEGYVKGPLRLESLDGSESYLTSQDEWHLKNEGPRIIDGKIYGITHLQKKSPRFWLKASPDCYHWGHFWNLQEEGKPGTERGIYFRKGTGIFNFKCWRWQADKNAPWVLSGGYFGGHLD